MNTPSTYYRFSLVVVLLLLTTGGFAQQLFTVTGVIFKKNTPITIAQATIINNNRKTIATSDDLGGFHILAALDDTLVFKKSDYAVQYIVVQTKVNLSIYMDPVIQLQQVNIKDVSRRQELANVMDEYKRKNQYSSLKPSIGSVLNSPISGLYSLFSKGADQARKFEQYSREEMQRVAISKRYNSTLIKRITNIPDDEIKDFMLAFTPTYDDILIWSDYDIVNYIKRSYEYFQSHKGALKAEKLY